MRLAWVTGKVTMSSRLDELKSGSWLICEAVDADGLRDMSGPQPRTRPMPESLVIFDQLGAGFGDLVAFSEGAEATQPFRPDRVPIDSITTAIIDSVRINHD